jgi:hypothetical protein
MSKLLLSIFALHLVLGHIGIQGQTVLCIDDNGRAAIENILEQVCCKDIKSTSLTKFNTLQQVNTSSENHCGNCTDIPILTECHEYYKAQIRDWIPKLGVLNFSNFPFCQFKTDTKRHVSIETNTHNFSNPSNLSIRTTVLLI